MVNLSIQVTMVLGINGVDVLILLRIGGFGAGQLLKSIENDGEDREGQKGRRGQSDLSGRGRSFENLLNCYETSKFYV